MANTLFKNGLDELRTIRRRSRSLYWAVGIFSFFANMLMLTGPLYMMQVYDRVLGSRSEQTLVALSLLVLFLYGMMGAHDMWLAASPTPPILRMVPLWLSGRASA